jgi:hypothetical protein
VTDDVLAALADLSTLETLLLSRCREEAPSRDPFPFANCTSLAAP